MSDDTVTTLTAAGYSLYCYQAVATNILGWPTVWYKSSNLTPIMTIQFALTFGAYTSLQINVMPPQTIFESAVYSIATGQTLEITSPTGTGMVSTNGTPDIVSIVNETTTQFTVGTTQQAGTTAGTPTAPTCALPLFGGNAVLVQPLNKALLALESGSRKIGQTVRQLASPSLLVAMDGSETRSVTYDLNTNWNANTQAWAKTYAAGTDIAKILISPILTPARDTGKKKKDA